MEKSFGLPDTNLRRQVDTAKCSQHMKKAREGQPMRPGDLSLGPRKQKRNRGSNHHGYKPESTFSTWMVQSWAMRKKTKHGHCKDLRRTGTHTSRTNTKTSSSQSRRRPAPLLLCEGHHHACLQWVGNIP